LDRGADRRRPILSSAFTATTYGWTPGSERGCFGGLNRTGGNCRIEGSSGVKRYVKWSAKPITGATGMPIRRYVENGVVFRPQTLSAMSNAFAAATETLGIGGDEIKRQAVAKFIIKLAQEDGNLDATTLRDRAVAALGDSIQVT
jgi:hypothetical protein